MHPSKVLNGPGWLTWCSSTCSCSQTGNREEMILADALQWAKSALQHADIVHQVQKGGGSSHPTWNKVANVRSWLSLRSDTKRRQRYVERQFHSPNKSNGLTGRTWNTMNLPVRISRRWREAKSAPSSGPTNLRPHDLLVNHTKVLVYLGAKNPVESCGRWSIRMQEAWKMRIWQPRQKTHGWLTSFPCGVWLVSISITKLLTVDS